MKLSNKIAMGGLLSIALSVPAHAGVEAQISLSDVPEAAMQSAKDLMPETRFVSANTETEEDGTMVYEIQGITKDGRHVEVDTSAEGEVEELEVEFSRDLVPGAVLNAIEAAYPGFEASYIEASHSRSKKVMQYEIVGKHGDKVLDLEVSADGRKIIESDR